MKRNRVILLLLSTALLTVVLLGSGGITLIIHSCEMCNTSTVETLSIIHPQADYVACCSTPMEKTAQEGNSFSASCCKNKTEQFKLPNYVKSEKAGQPFLSHSFFIVPFVFIPEYTAQIFKPRDILNKYGGRKIVTSNCQFIS